MKMPEGFLMLKGLQDSLKDGDDYDLIDIGAYKHFLKNTPLDLMKEMAEALEYFSNLDPNTGYKGLQFKAQDILTKFKEWE